MSQQYPQGFPGQPQQQQPQYQQPQYPPQQQPQYQQPQYPGGYQQVPQYQPPMQPTAPLASGSLDEFFDQPSSGGGVPVSWKDRPDGYRVVGIVARDIGKGDVLHQTDPQTKQPKYYRDGRPMFVMVVPLLCQPSQDFPEGECKLFVRGQLRDELTRAMTEKGLQPNTAPQKDAGIVVTLVGRKPGRGMPSNVFAVEYFPPEGSNTGAAVSTPATAPAQAQQNPAANPQDYAQAQQVQQPQPAPVYTQQPQPQGVQVQTGPVQQQPNQPQPPSDLSADQQALLGRLTGGNAA